jgi:hypothetical protein
MTEGSLVSRIPETRELASQFESGVKRDEPLKFIQRVLESPYRARDLR